MKTEYIDSENPLKSAFFTLRELRDEGIKDSKLEETINNLSELIEMSQNGDLN